MTLNNTSTVFWLNVQFSGKITKFRFSDIFLHSCLSVKIKVYPDTRLLIVISFSKRCRKLQGCHWAKKAKSTDFDLLGISLTDIKCFCHFSMFKKIHAVHCKAWFWRKIAKISISNYESGHVNNFLNTIMYLLRLFHYCVLCHFYIFGSGNLVKLAISFRCYPHSLTK